MSKSDFPEKSQREDTLTSLSLLPISPVKQEMEKRKAKENLEFEGNNTTSSCQKPQARKSLKLRWYGTYAVHT